jgi:hypothetical protein
MNITYREHVVQVTRRLSDGFHTTFPSCLRRGWLTLGFAWVRGDTMRP